MASIKTSTELYTYIGEAVVVCRFVETTFLIFMQLVLDQADCESLEEVQKVSVSKALKKHTREYLNELVKKNAIDEDLAAKIRIRIEDRHRIIHGDYMNLWTDVSPSIRPMPDIAFCKRVINEGFDILEILISLTIEWMRKFPAMVATAKSLQPNQVEAVKQLFARIAEERGAFEQR